MDDFDKFPQAGGQLAARVAGEEEPGVSALQLQAGLYPRNKRAYAPADTTILAQTPVRCEDHPSSSGSCAGGRTASAAWWNPLARDAGRFHPPAGLFAPKSGWPPAAGSVNMTPWQCQVQAGIDSTGEPRSGAFVVRRLRATTAIALLLTASLMGCRMPWREGPVPKSLATSRQFSQQGIAAMERGQRDQAETLLAKAVTAYPNDPEARRHYAEALWQRGARQEAIAELEQSSRLSGDDPVVRVRLAEMYLATGRIETAQTVTEQVLGVNPRLASAWAIRARLMRAAGDARQALADYHRALALVPDDRQICLEMAELYRDLNQPHDALVTLQGLADTYTPGDEPPQVLYLLGRAYVALGRHEEGVEALSSAASRVQPTAEILCRLAEAQFLAGHAAEAQAAARQALTLEPGHVPSRQLLDRLELADRAQVSIRR